MSELGRRLKGDKVRLSAQLIRDLKYLSIKIDRCISDVEAGRLTDANLISNASPLTEVITRWNLTLDLIPFTED